MALVGPCIARTPAAGQVDLLTVLSHEIGHVLGYDHSDSASDLMAATSAAGHQTLAGTRPNADRVEHPRIAITAKISRDET